jgi:hypothetical protein
LEGVLPEREVAKVTAIQGNIVPEGDPETNVPHGRLD